MAAHQAPLSLGFFRQEYWSGLPFPSPKKGLNDLDNHDGVVSHIEQDILECEVKRALGSITKNNDNPLQYSCLENPMDRGAW